MFVEPGEECDCGLLENCKNPCCNAATCKLYPNATCGTGPCCDMRVGAIVYLCSHDIHAIQVPV